MTILRDERCIRSLVTMDDALSAVEAVFRAQGTGENGGVTNVPRVRMPVKNGIVRITAAMAYEKAVAQGVGIPLPDLAG